MNALKKDQHPLEHIIIAMAEANKILDVSSVSSTLSGDVVFRGKDADKGHKAYRIVAADVLGYMTHAGRLEMHGLFGKYPEDGGPWFSLTNQEAPV